MNSKGELGATHDEYASLKSRVKLVAGELKERRVECRDLKGKIEELEQANEKLEDHISNLESQLSDRDRSGSEKDEEVNKLCSTIAELEQKLVEADKKAKAKEDAFESNLATYKKKAQNSLAIANARAAAAVQAKEEAELEARAARSTADATMEKARIAEENGQKAMVDAKNYYKEMEEAKETAVNELESSKVELEKVKSGLNEVSCKLELCVAERDTLVAEKAQRKRDIEIEQSKASALQRDLNEAQLGSRALQSEIADMQRRLQQAESAAVNADKKVELNGGPESSRHVSVNAQETEDSTSKGTIIMLQNQLKEANATIEELRDALQNAVAMTDKSSAAEGSASPGKREPNGTNGNESSSPLFYAMEKQAELNTARNEINRLASLYADVQFEKNEAEEALQATRKELAEEKAKLQRYEKLGSGDSASSGTTVNPDKEKIITGSAGRTNIEYLKNIMLSFLNAKSLSERKALIPVIGAVLCLTPDEQAGAIQNVESTGGIEGFSSAFFETIGSRVSRTG